MAMPFSITSTGRNISAMPQANGDMRDMGEMTVGDYFARGSRVRKSEGIGWLEIAMVGGIGLVALQIWKK